MGSTLESGLGKAVKGDPLDLGRFAAEQALSQLREFKPSLALVFVSPELDIPEVNRGIAEVMRDCPILGTSTAGEIANGFVKNSVVVAVLASPYLRVRVGMGRGVSIDFERAVHDALGEAGVSDYFDPGNPLHQTLNLSAAGTSAVSPVLLLAFSPGATKNQPSLSHDIHTMLRKGSANRIPIFGGSSADYFRYESNCQIVNSRVANDAVAIAFIETEILFGLGMANGFSPTTKRALVTEAEGHVVKQLDGRPAAEVYAEFLGIPDRALMAEHAAGPLPLSGYPFGSTDVYGNSILHVPERILDNGSIIFPQLMKNHQVITLMHGPREDVVKAGVSAYEKAIRHGGLNKPSVGFMFSCALRLTGESEQEEVVLLRRKAKIPICGFYTYGEKGIFDDGLPVYSNQSVSMLVFSDELNPVASLIHEGKRIHHEFTSRLNRKVSQIKSINRINMIIQDGTDVSRLLTALTSELSALFPWAHGAFYLSTDELETYAIASASDFDAFPEELRTDKAPSDYILIKLDSPRKCFGYLVLKERKDGITPEEEDLVLAETIARLTASGLHRIELDGRLEAKLQQLDILNQLGHELSKSISTSSQSQNMVRHIRRILKLSFASLWLVDRSHHLLVKEAVDVDPGTKLGKLETENDERVTKWQMENKESLLVAKPTNDSCPISLLSPFPFSFITLPVISKGELLGNLNLYSSHSFKWPLQHDRIFENMDFLRSISTQIAMFHENRSLHKHATFNKEIHHRVKNNLQNIASLLRLQLRRLDHLSPEQALTDSISRIMSMALVHETLSQNEIGMVDLGPLLGSISKVPDFPDRQMITLDVSGPPVLLPSREATSLALVVNELVQNALHHGLGRRRDGKISLRIERTDSLISVVVQDDGPGLTENFDPGRHANLGLTIVRTLVKEDLKGEFSIGSEDGTKATVTFPLPEGCYQID